MTKPAVSAGTRHGATPVAHSMSATAPHDVQTA
jgi:hypothetical protein